MLGADPAPLYHQILTHQGDVRGWAAKGSKTQAGEIFGQVHQAGALRGSIILCVHANPHIITGHWSRLSRKLRKSLCYLTN